MNNFFVKSLFSEPLDINRTKTNDMLESPGEEGAPQEFTRFQNPEYSLLVSISPERSYGSEGKPPKGIYWLNEVLYNLLNAKEKPEEDKPIDIPNSIPPSDWDNPGHDPYKRSMNYIIYDNKVYLGVSSTLQALNKIAELNPVFLGEFKIINSKTKREIYVECSKINRGLLISARIDPLLETTMETRWNADETDDPDSAYPHKWFTVTEVPSDPIKEILKRMGFEHEDKKEIEKEK